MLFPSKGMPLPRIGSPALTLLSDDISPPPYDSGRDVVLSKRDTLLMELSVAYSRACWNSFRELRRFFGLVKARGLPFSFEIPFGSRFELDERLGYEFLYVGVASGSEQRFDLPCLDAPATLDKDHWRLHYNKRDDFILTTDYQLRTNALSLPNSFIGGADAWTGIGAGYDSFVAGQSDPDGFSNATLLRFSGVGPVGELLTLNGSAGQGTHNVLALNDVLGSLWVKPAAATSDLQLIVGSDSSGSDRTVFNQGPLAAGVWTRLREQHTVRANGHSLIGFQFATGAPAVNLTVYLARIGPGRDGRIQADFVAPPSGGTLLELSARVAATIDGRFSAKGLQWTPTTGYVVDVTVGINERRVP